MLNLTVMVEAQQSGTGIVYGHDKDFVYVVTAAHVAGPQRTGAVVRIRFHTSTGLQDLPCEVTASEQRVDATSDPTPDLAILTCPARSAEKYSFDYVVAADASELGRGAPLMMIGNLTRPWHVPLSYFLLSEVDVKADPPVIDYYNPLKLQLQGASGGPLLTERSELIGLTYSFSGEEESIVKALPWVYVKNWLEKNGTARVRIARRARSASQLRRTNVELAVSAASVNLGRFGWFQPVPSFRISSSLPAAPSISASFDFTYARQTRESRGETVGITIPAFMAEWQGGGLLPFTRTRDLLGGIYVAGGVAPSQIERELVFSQERATLRTWTFLFDAGWRYRLPGKMWGVTASWREGLLVGDETRAFYERVRSLRYGIFVTLR